MVTSFLCILSEIIYALSVDGFLIVGLEVLEMGEFFQY